MPSGIYVRSDEHKNKLRHLAKRNIDKYFTPYAKSEKGKDASRQHLISYNKSEKHRNLVIEMNKTFNYGGKFLSEYNKSEKHKQDICLRCKQRTTKSQRSLSKALSDNGISNQKEKFIRKFRRFIDIALPKFKIAIEVDGESHSNPYPFWKFTKEEKIVDDKLKEKQLESLGWKIMRFENKEVDKNIKDVILKVKEEVGNKNASGNLYSNP